MQTVIYLAFANSSTAPLPRLTEEDDQLVELLHDRWVNQKHFHVHRDSHADTNSLRRFLTEYKNKLAIFHYGGHAGGEALLLTTGTAQAEGIADMLSKAEQPNLKLVFLNGCSTEGQVRRLLELGIPIVIATEAPVDDQMATRFSRHFYHALSLGDTLGQAYDKAAAYLKTEGRLITLLRDRLEDAASDQPYNSWGIYYLPENRAVLDWKLPDRAPLPPPPPPPPNDPNYYQGVLEAMLEHNPLLERKLYDEEDELIDPKFYPDLITQSFPWPIGAQLRILSAKTFGMNLPGPVRLHQQLEVFQAISRFLSYVLLSEIWDWKRDQVLPIKGMPGLTWTQQDFEQMSFFGLLKDLLAFSRNNNISLFLPEMADCISEDKSHACHQAYTLFEDVRQQVMAGGLSDEAAREWSPQLDYYLSLVLRQIAFLAKYKLYAIKNIDVLKVKHVALSYNHRLGKLHAGEERALRYNQNLREIAAPSFSYSILLIRSLKEIQDDDKVLNLSPFLVDKHAFDADMKNRNQEPNLFAYAYRENGHYVYQSITANVLNKGRNAGDWLRTDKDTYDLLCRQFQTLDQDFQR